MEASNGCPFKAHMFNSRPDPARELIIFGPRDDI